MTAEGQPDTHLRGRWLSLARAMWLALALVALILFAAGNLAALREPPPVCAKPEVECDPISWNSEDLELIRAAGLPVGLFPDISFAFTLVANLAYIVVATLIAWRKSDDWMALLLSLTLLLLGAVALSPANSVLESTQPEWRPLIAATEAPAYLTVCLLIYIFPDGRFRPRWAGLVCVLMLFVLLMTFLTDLVPAWLLLLVLVGYMAIGLYSLAYRYRRESSPLQRQQAKWMAVGLMAVFVSIVFWVFASVTFPPDQPTVARAYFLLISLPLDSLILPLFPICVAIAIFRYRLWDIDFLIRRTLIYGALTVALALVYFGSVVLLQGLFRVLVGQDSQFSVVVSTLAIAALFSPLRGRVQDVIDRRFYRRKYDAAKTLADFSATVRDETDLDKLTERLVAVVQETMQPAHVSLWLKPIGDRGRQTAGGGDRAVQHRAIEEQ